MKAGYITLAQVFEECKGLYRSEMVRCEKNVIAESRKVAKLPLDKHILLQTFLIFNGLKLGVTGKEIGVAQLFLLKKCGLFSL